MATSGRSPAPPAADHALLGPRLAERIRSNGPMSFAAFMEAALYAPDGGFYATGGHAGRRGDFLTSPEVGPLFGAVLARALDGWWEELGRPSPFTVVDAGAGRGALARAVLAARPACEAAGALRYVAVERSAAQRAEHASLAIESMSNLPPRPFTGVVIANELLDNLPFRLAVFDGGWREAFVDVAGDGRFVEVLRDFGVMPACLPSAAPHGARAPVQEAAAAWVDTVLARLERGRMVVFDYARTTEEMAALPWREWLRTYRQHERGGHYLADPGSQDITADVALDQLPAPSSSRAQADFLRAHGLEELVDDGRRIWNERAARPDLAALAARSRVSEAEALTDPTGLGGFTVDEWVVD
jgi:SAM-dependent MidA family methyltransferase